MSGHAPAEEFCRLVPGYIIAKLEGRPDDQARILNDMLAFGLPREEIAIVVAGISTSIIEGVCRGLDVDPVEVVRHTAFAAAASFDPADETDDDIS
jgi:hypothetical protein